MAASFNLFGAHRKHHRHGGFTIVEMLVVIGIIALLVGLLFPALSGVQRRSRKTTELNFIKQLGHAWMLYANNNNDACLPGYLSEDVQKMPVQNVSRGWGVNYQNPNRINIVPGPNNITGPWTWRLLSYVDYNHELVHGYKTDEPNQDAFTLITEAQSVAYEPAFGYNGYYIGGWWDEFYTPPQPAPPSPALAKYPVHHFYSDCALANPDNPAGSRVTIPQSISQIRRSSEIVTFCSAAKFNDGPSVKGKLPADFPGAHVVTPPNLRNVEQWKPEDANPLNNLQILVGGDVYAPIGRHTGTIAVLWADGHCDTQSYNALYDQRKWINSANHRLYKHDVCPP